MIPEIDIWRAATLMLERYGENAELESGTRQRTRGGRRPRRRRGLAPHHAWRRPARHHDAIRPAELTAEESFRGSKRGDLLVVGMWRCRQSGLSTCKPIPPLCGPLNHAKRKPPLKYEAG
jgi:hypothetical protein